MEWDNGYLSALELAKILSIMQVYYTTLSKFIFIITIMDLPTQTEL